MLSSFLAAPCPVASCSECAENNINCLRCMNGFNLDRQSNQCVRIAADTLDLSDTEIIGNDCKRTCVAVRMSSFFFDSYYRLCCHFWCADPQFSLVSSGLHLQKFMYREKKLTHKEEVRRGIALALALEQSMLLVCQGEMVQFFFLSLSL